MGMYVPALHQQQTPRTGSAERCSTFPGQVRYRLPRTPETSRRLLPSIRRRARGFLHSAPSVLPAHRYQAICQRPLRGVYSWPPARGRMATLRRGSEASSSSRTVLQVVSVASFMVVAKRCWPERCTSTTVTARKTVCPAALLPPTITILL